MTSALDTEVVDLQAALKTAQDNLGQRWADLTEIAIINESSVLTDAQVASVVAPLQLQITRDFAPIWGANAKLKFYSRTTPPPATAWQMGVFDTSDQAGALGYHDLTPAGYPLGKVFAKSDIDAGMSWTVTISHETLEVLGDPDIFLVSLVLDASGNARAYAYEACDACEADQFGYLINGVLLSDFVYPAWFGAGHGPYDYGGHISGPLQLLVGGYIGLWTPTAGWTQQTAEKTPLRYSARPSVGSRRERRRTPREQWLLSTTKLA